MQRSYGSGRLERSKSYGGDRLVYYGIWTDARGRRRKQILSSDKRVAERALAKIIRDRDLEVLGLKDEEGQDFDLGDLRDRYLAELATWTKPTQVRRVTGVLKKLIDHLGPCRVRELRVPQILTFRQARLRQKAANRTVNLEVNALRSMLKWALECGLIGRNPLENVKPLPAGKAHEKHPRRALSRDEIGALLSAAERIDERRRARWAAEKSIEDGSRGKAFRDRKRRVQIPQGPLWRALIYTGARWGELTATVWADYDATERSLRLRPETTKSAKIRVLPLTADVAAGLETLRAIHTALLGHEPLPGEHIFLGPRGSPVHRSYRRALYRFRELLAEAGIPDEDELGRKIDIHAMRHTFASELGRAGVGLTQAQALMGHSDPKLTAALYTHLGVEDLRGAVDRLERRA